MEFFHHKTKYPFMATRRRWYLVSAVLIVAALTSFAVRGLNLGIDFTGGVVLELEFAQDANLEQVRTSLEHAGFAHAAVQSFGTSRDVMVRLLPQEGEDTNQVAQSVLSAIQAQDPSVELRRTEVVGPQVGAELANKGALAIVFTFVGILIYVAFRFQWKLGVGAIVRSARPHRHPRHLLRDADDLRSAGAGGDPGDHRLFAQRHRGRLRPDPRAVPVAAQGNARAGHRPGDQRDALAHDHDAPDDHDHDHGAADLRRRGAARLLVALAIGVVVGTYSSIYIASAIALDLKLTARDLMPVQKERGSVDGMP
jgi:preprotein translocase subunit SecF